MRQRWNAAVLIGAWSLLTGCTVHLEVTEVDWTDVDWAEVEARAALPEGSPIRRDELHGDWLRARPGELWLLRIEPERAWLTWSVAEGPVTVLRVTGLEAFEPGEDCPVQLWWPGSSAPTETTLAATDTYLRLGPEICVGETDVSPFWGQAMPLFFGREDDLLARVRDSETGIADAMIVAD